MAEIRAGDLVSWAAGQKTKVGVVRTLNEDGSCTVDLSTTAGRFEERIGAARLVRLTSTVEPAPQMSPASTPTHTAPEPPAPACPCAGPGSSDA